MKTKMVSVAPTGGTWHPWADKPSTNLNVYADHPERGTVVVATAAIQVGQGWEEVYANIRLLAAAPKLKAALLDALPSLSGDLRAMAESALADSHYEYEALDT